LPGTPELPRNYGEGPLTVAISQESRRSHAGLDAAKDNRIWRLEQVYPMVIPRCK